MSEPHLQEQIAAATAYEALFVPALFQPWAPLVVSAAHDGGSEQAAIFEPIELIPVQFLTQR